MALFRTIAAAGVALAIGTSALMAKDTKKMNYIVDRFADIEVLRYPVPGFEELSLNQKKLVYYLTEAALAGRDILWDQNNRYNLDLRKLLENIYSNYDGAKDNPDFKAFETYLKQVEFGNGVHHHYSMDKFVPEFSEEFFDAQVSKLPALKRPATLDSLRRLVFDPAFMAKKVNQAEGQDLIATSATNLYEGVTQKEVEDFYAAIKDTTDVTPISYGLNRRVTKENGKVVEQTYKMGGLYSPAIERIVANLNQAAMYA